MTGSSPAFLVVCLGPTVQRTVTLETLRPGEVNRGRRVRVDASGKGVNVARVLVQLGHRALHLTHAGGARRDWFLSRCAADGIEVIAPDSASEIRTCVTLLDASEGRTTEIVEPTEPVHQDTQAAVLADFGRLLNDTHTVILSGSIPPGYGERVFPEMVLRAKRAGCRVVADFRGEALKEALEYEPEVIKPNLQEFAATFCPDVPGPVPEETVDSGVLERVEGEMLRIAARGTTVVITRGSNLALYTDGGVIKRSPPARIDPVNTIGCGDAFTAGIAAALFEGEPIAAAVERGHECAARNALLERPGAIRA